MVEARKDFGKVVGLLKNRRVCVCVWRGGTRDMTQQLRTLTTLPKDLDSVANTQIMANSCL